MKKEKVNTTTVSTNSKSHRKDTDNEEHEQKVLNFLLVLSFVLSAVLIHIVGGAV